MSDELPGVDALRAEHARLERELKRMEELAEQLARDEGFDELDRLAQVLKADMDRHFPTQEKLARSVFDADDEALADLLAQHHDLTTHYRTLLAMIQDVRDDMPVDRERFMTTVRGVLAQLKAHLDAEKRLLLPRLDEG